MWGVFGGQSPLFLCWGFVKKMGGFFKGAKATCFLHPHVLVCPDCGEILLKNEFGDHMKKFHPDRDFEIIPFKLGEA